MKTSKNIDLNNLLDAELKLLELSLGKESKPITLESGYTCKFSERIRTPSSPQFNGYNVFVKREIALFDPSGKHVVSVYGMIKTTSPPERSDINNLSALKETVLDKIAYCFPETEILSNDSDKIEHSRAPRYLTDERWEYTLIKGKETKSYADGYVKLRHLDTDSRNLKEVAIQKIKIRFFTDTYR